MTAEDKLGQVVASDPGTAIELWEWVQYTALYLSRLEEVAMPLSYTEWRELMGYEPGCWGWDGEQVIRAAFYAAQPGCCA